MTVFYPSSLRVVCADRPAIVANGINQSGANDQWLARLAAVHLFPRSIHPILALHSASGPFTVMIRL
jgi:hypothetical protein